MITLTTTEREAIALLAERVIPLCNEIRTRQVRNGSIEEPTDSDRALVEELAGAAREALVRLDHAEQGEALHADIGMWLAAGLDDKPDFARTRDAVRTPADGELGVFVGPVLMTNSEPPVKNGFEAFLVRRREPDALAEISRRYPHPKNVCQSVQLLAGSDGVTRGNCIVFFPENIPAAVRPTSQAFAMFFFSKFRRIHETFAVPAAETVLTADSVPRGSSGLSPRDCYEARSLWGYLHDYFHHQGPKPFDEHINVKLNWFVGLLEEIKVDCQTLLACAEADIPFADAQIDMILLERMFRYPLDAEAERVFDSGTGVLLFSWLRDHGAITAAEDGFLRLCPGEVFPALHKLVESIQAIETSVESDDEYRATAKAFVRRYLAEGVGKDRYAFSADQSVLRRHLATASAAPALVFGGGEL